MQSGLKDFSSQFAVELQISQQRSNRSLMTERAIQTKLDFVQPYQPNVVEETPTSQQEVTGDVLDINQIKYKIISERRSRIQLDHSPPLKVALRKYFIKYHGTRDLTLKFIKIMKRSSNTLRFSDLNQKQVSIIQSILKIKAQIKANLFCKLPVLQITSWFSILHDLLQIIIGIVTSFWFPLDISFDISTRTEFTANLSIFLIILNFGELILSFNRVIIEKGAMINDRMIIFKKQISRQCVKHIASNLCLTSKFVIRNPVIPILFSLLWVFVNVPRLYQNLEMLKDYFNISITTRDIISLLKMILILMFAVHISACIWHGIATIQSYEQNWLTYYGFSSAGVLERYLVSVYWAAMTVTTVGYGDITPKNELEYICANCTMLIACIMFGFTMNRIGMLLSNIYMRKAEYNKKVALLNIYMNRNNVTYELQLRIKSYLDYLWQIENDHHQQEVDSMISKLSDQLKVDLQEQVQGAVINKCKILTTFSPDFKKKLCSIVENVQVPPNELLFDSKRGDDGSFYIIQEGSLQIQMSQEVESNLLLQFQPGNSVGEVSFFTNQPRLFNVFSVDFLSLAKIPRPQFLRLLDNFQRDKELYFYIKDSITFNQQYSKIYAKCILCESSIHLMNKCPLVNLNIDSEKIIKTFNYPTQQRRKKLNEKNDLNIRKRKKYQTLINMQFMNHFVEQFQQEREQERTLASSNTNHDFRFSDPKKKSLLQYQSELEEFRLSKVEIVKTFGSEKLKSLQTGFQREQLKIINGQDQAYIYSIEQDVEPELLIINDEEASQMKKSQRDETQKNYLQNDNHSAQQVKDYGSNLDRYTTKNLKPSWVPLNCLSCIHDFDKMQNFTNYFPLGNIDNVLKKVNTLKKPQGQWKPSLFTLSVAVQKKIEKVKQKAYKTDQSTTARVGKSKR